MQFRMKPGVGKHHMVLGGKDRILSPGDAIDCKEEDLGAAIDKFDQLGAEAPPVNRFTILDRKNGFYDVIHPVTHVAINTKALRKSDAELLAGKTLEQYEAEVTAAKLAEEEAEAERFAEAKRLEDEANEAEAGA